MVIKIISLKLLISEGQTNIHLTVYSRITQEGFISAAVLITQGDIIPGLLL